MSQEQAVWARLMPLERRIELSSIFMELRSGVVSIQLDEILSTVRRTVDVRALEYDDEDKEELEIKILDHLARKLIEASRRLKSAREEERNPTPRGVYHPELQKGFTYGT